MSSYYTSTNSSSSTEARGNSPSSSSSSLSSNNRADIRAARQHTATKLAPHQNTQPPPPVFGSIVQNNNKSSSSHHHNNNNDSSSNASSSATGIDFRQDLNLLHENAKLSLDRTRQFYEQELAQRDEYIQRLGTDFQHNLTAAQGLESECDRLRSEVEELNRLETKNEETVKRLAETNGALSEQNARLKQDLDEALKKYDTAVQKARSEISSTKQDAEAEKGKRSGEFKAHKEALEQKHAREMQELKQQHEEAEHLWTERQDQLERERNQLEAQVSSLERKLASSNAERTSLQHSLQVSKKREEEAENRNRSLIKQQDELSMELSRLRDENISLCVERDGKKSELESAVQSSDRSFSTRISQLNGELSRVQNSEKSLKDLVENLKGQLADERSLRRKETDEAELRLFEMRKQIDEAREAAHGSASTSQQEAQTERRKIMSELNDQIAESLKHSRRADDLDRKLQQAQFEQTLSKQRIDALSAELVQQRENFRADTVKIQQLHAEDAERWREETRKLKQEFNASEEARCTLENVIQDHVDREKRTEALLADREQLAERVKSLTEENEKVRAVVREMTDEMTHDPVVANAREQAGKIVSLEAELARAKNQTLELDVRLQSCETELREERREYEIRKQQHAETVKNLTSDMTMLRSMLQQERDRKNSFVDATLAGVSRWTVQAAGPTQALGGVPENQANRWNNTSNNNNHPTSLRQHHQHQTGESVEQLEADAAAAVLADRLDTEALHHELSRLELVVSTQQKQLSDLITQRAQHVAQIADLKSMLEAVSHDRASMTEINNALRHEARGAEAEVARLQGEIAGLRGNLVRVRNQRAEEHLAQQQQQNQNQNQNQNNRGSSSRPVSPNGNHQQATARKTFSSSASSSSTFGGMRNTTAAAPLHSTQKKMNSQPLSVQGQGTTASSNATKKINHSNNNNQQLSSSASVYGRPVTSTSLPNQPVGVVRTRGNVSVRNYAVED